MLVTISGGIGAPGIINRNNCMHLIYRMVIITVPKLWDIFSHHVIL